MELPPPPPRISGAEASRRWRAAHPEDAITAQQKWLSKMTPAQAAEFTSTVNRRKSMRLRQEFLDAYGNACACCGETDERFLTIGHVGGAGSGKAHRQQVNNGTRRLEGTSNDIIRDLRRRSWPQGEVRTECFNCNLGGARNRMTGTCPHHIPLEIPGQLALFEMEVK